MACLDENTVDLFVQGALDEAARAAVEGHVAGCAACRILVSELMREPAADAAATFAEQGAPAPRTWSFGRPFSPSGAAEPSPLFRIGEYVADRYRILRFVAEGGMGEVYEAEDFELASRVGLKTIRPTLASDRRALERFRREITLARKVTHPNVCRIFDVGFHQRQERVAFLTMEFLDGETLAARLRRTGRLPLDEAAPIVAQMAAGLAAAHGAGVIHRDFKSQNVMLVPADGSVRAVITDFGLARGAAERDLTASSSSASGLVGSPAYMAPEQVAGREIDARADIYALGVVLYETVTGALPFVDETPMLTAVKRLREDPVSPRKHVPELDARWLAAILRCLERDPARRYASALDVARELDPTSELLPEPEPLPPPLLDGKRIGNFIIRRQVGAGPTATIYAAEHAQIDRRLAVKVLRPELRHSPLLIERFVADAKAVSALHNPHVVEIFDFGEIEGCTYFTMEWLSGITGAQALARGPFPIWRALDVIRGVGQALAAAHGRGVVHGGVSADTVFLVDLGRGREQVKILDFGVASLSASEPLEPAGDLRALGVLAVQMLTGASPPEPPAPLALDAPPALTRAIARCLSASTDERYASVTDFLADVDAAAVDLALPPPARRGLFIRIGVGAAALLLGALVLALALPRRDRVIDKPPPASARPAPPPAAQLALPPAGTPAQVVVPPARPPVRPAPNAVKKRKRPPPPKADDSGGLIRDYPQ